MGQGTLDLATRRRLYQCIRETPGLHQRALERATGLATGSVEHHLRVLMDEGLITARQEANRKRYFTTDVPRSDKEMLKHLRARTTRQAVLALLEAPGLSLSELADRVDLAPSSAHAHVKRLVEAGIVAKERRGRSVTLHVEAPGACIRVLTVYQQSFVDRAVDRFLEAIGSLDRDALHRG